MVDRPNVEARLGRILRRLNYSLIDLGIAVENFCLQAVELGYGTCWIGAFDENRVKAILGVPDERKVVICMTFGAPEGRHVPRGRKSLDEFIYLNQYGQRWRHDAP